MPKRTKRSRARGQLPVVGQRQVCVGIECASVWRRSLNEMNAQTNKRFLGFFFCNSYSRAKKRSKFSHRRVKIIEVRSLVNTVILESVGTDW
jgi:hypothetical protein